MAVIRANKIKFFDRNTEKPVGDIYYREYGEDFRGVMVLANNNFVPFPNAYTNDGVRFAIAAKHLNRLSIFQAKLTNCRHYVNM